jgi:magnesium chelatase subunit D
MATALAFSLRRKGPMPLVVFLTDGRANIGRGGRSGRAEALADALAAARALRASDLAAIVIDSSPRPTAAARDLAIAMGARYQPLPHADARLISRAVLAAAPGAHAATTAPEGHPR